MVINHAVTILPFHDKLNSEYIGYFIDYILYEQDATKTVLRMCIVWRFTFGAIKYSDKS